MLMRRCRFESRCVAIAPIGPRYVFANTRGQLSALFPMRVLIIRDLVMTNRPAGERRGQLVALLSILPRYRPLTK